MDERDGMVCKGAIDGGLLGSFHLGPPGVIDDALPDVGGVKPALGLGVGVGHYERGEALLQ